MKKMICVLAMIVAMFCFVQKSNAQNSASANFNLTMTVDKYIECTPGPLAWDFGTTMHTMLKAEELAGSLGIWNVAYANCPFSVTIAGNNGANQGVPRFAMKEVGAHGGAYDILNTVYEINFTTNGDHKSFNTGFFGLPFPIGAKDFPKTINFREAPHNGQVQMDMKAYVNTAVVGALFDHGTPIRQTLINPAFNNAQSADAGVYSCTMLVTLAAI